MCSASGDSDPNCNNLLLHQATLTTNENIVFTFDVRVLNYKRLFFHHPPVEDQLLYSPIMLVTEYVADIY